VSTLEKQIEVIKFMHKPRKLKDVQTKFNVDPKTLWNWFAKGQVKINNISWPMYRKSKGEGKGMAVADPSKEYISTVHPIILPLNLTQVFALTTRLQEITKDIEVENKIYREITNMIYSQLSDYAKKIVCNNDEIYFNELSEIKYKEEKEIDNSVYDEEILAYCLKTQDDYEFTLKPNRKQVIGKLKNTTNGKVIVSNNEIYKLSDVMYINKP